MSDLENLRVVTLDQQGLALCDLVHAQSAAPLIYGSSAYIRFLLEALPRTRLYLLMAMRGDVPVGYFPLLGQAAASAGFTVLNSLPFFGSHGGPIVRKSEPNTALIIEALLTQAIAIAHEDRMASITLIENPLVPMDAELLARHGLLPLDDRIGQLTPLPHASTMEEAQAALLSIFHVKTRNTVRKGQRLMQQFERRTDDEALQWLQATHARSIVALGGVPKPLDIFNMLLKQLSPTTGVRLYLGTIDGQPASGLLLLQYGNTTEYFTPVVADEYKDQQALSALILHAMAEAVVEGREFWNWGGTWRSQEGVYRFKNRFGAIDKTYRYFFRLLQPSLSEMSGSMARQEFPYFYTHRYTS